MTGLVKLRHATQHWNSLFNTESLCALTSNMCSLFAFNDTSLKICQPSSETVDPLFQET